MIMPFDGTMIVPLGLNEAMTMRPDGKKMVGRWARVTRDCSYSALNEKRFRKLQCIEHEACVVASDNRFYRGASLRTHLE